MNKISIIAFTCTLLASSLPSFGKSRAESTETVKASLEQLAAGKAYGAGLVTRPGKGCFAIVSKPIPEIAGAITSAVSSLSSQLKFPIKTIENTASFDFKSLSVRMEQLGLTVAIFIESDEKMPLSILSIEEKWAMINVSGLLDGKLSNEKTNLRFRRELSRVTKALFSGVNVNKDAVAATKWSDLDELVSDPIDATTLVTIARGLPSYGLQAPRTVPYHRACREGWAPAPTNAVQKAIWEEVHQLPSKPIKIEFDEKKGK